MASNNVSAFFTEEELKALSDYSNRISKALRFDSKELTEERIEAMDAKEQQVANALLSSRNRNPTESNGDNHADVG